MDASVRNGKIYAFGRFQLDPTRRTLTLGEAPVALSPTVFDTLLYLVEHSGRVVTKAELMVAIWPRKVVEDSNISQTIFTLRKALAAADQAETYIVTHPGQGYRFAAPVVAHARNPEIPAASPPARARPKVSGRGLVLAGVACLAAAGAGGAWLMLRRPPAPPLSQKKVVLADFQNLSGEGLLDRTFTEAARIDLYQSPYVAVLPAQKVRDTLSLMTRSPDEALTPALAQQVCQRDDDAATVSGVIARAGKDYLLTLTATSCADGSVLAADKAEVASREALLPALDSMAARLRRRLGESAASVHSLSAPLLQARTGSLEALKAYSEAQYDVSHGDALRARALYQQAVDLDPSFAMAYLGLAAIYNNAQDFDRGAAYATKAYDLRLSAGEHDRYRIIGRYDENVSNDTLEAIQAYRAWSAVYPGDNVPWSNLSNALNWIGQYREAIEPARRGLALSPQNEASYVVLARALMHDGQVQAAADICAQAVARGVAGDTTHGLLTEIAAARHDDDGIRREMAWGHGRPGERAILVFAARNAYREGRARQGEALYAQASALSHAQGLADYTLPFRAREMADLGLARQAANLLAQVPDSDDDDSDFIFSQAEFGDEHRALALLGRGLQRSPRDVLNNGVFAPETRAVLALRHGRPQEAIADLRLAAPYEMRAFDTPYLKGRTDLAAGDGADAVIEFHKIIDHPDIEPTSPLQPLAWLGLARALRLQGRTADSRAAYAHVLGAWKDADPDLPILAQARAEYARLGSAT